MNSIKYLPFLLILAVLSSCHQDPPVPISEGSAPVYDIHFRVPAGWPHPVYNFENNQLTEEGFILGRALFYETKLSRDNTISCGSCHQQFAAFSHSAHNVSHGIDGLLGTRNSPGLFNLNWHSSYMWDGGVNHLELQPLDPITNPVEMDETLLNVIAKLRQEKEYKRLFKDAYGSDTITSQGIFKALAQFMGMLNSNDSKFDRFRRGETTLTAQENHGLQVFTAKCGSCHTEPLFSDFTFRNVGLPKDPNINDQGRATITGLADDLNKYKVPSLRNVAVSSPYMHDGRFNTLDQVLEHYISGVEAGPGVDALIGTGIPINPQERGALLSFLNTLTDTTFLNDPRFADPN